MLLLFPLVRPLHRWTSLWLGLFDAAFLAWAWWDSYHHFTRITWVGHGFAWSGAGRIAYSHFPQVAATPFDLSVSREPISGVWLAGIFAKFRTHVLPYPLLLVTYLIAWTSYLLWRWRRLQHLTKITPPADR